MSYRDGNWSQRFGALGDESEAKFDEMFPAHHKSGLNRPPMRVSDVDPLLRNLPDRMVHDRFIECLGFGRDRVAKFKVEKLRQQLRWSAICPVSYFVYDKTKNESYLADIGEWWLAAIRHGKYGSFESDGNEYIGLHVDHFPAGSLLEDAA